MTADNIGNEFAYSNDTWVDKETVYFLLTLDHFIGVYRSQIQLQSATVTNKIGELEFIISDLYSKS